MPTQHTVAPLIGVTGDVELVAGSSTGAWRVRVGAAYLDAITRAGGLPVVLHPDASLIPVYLNRLDGLLLTGGNDVDTTVWGIPRHPQSEVMDPRRQTFEFALLSALDAGTTPALGVCLGMQLMGVHRAGAKALIQHLPDSVPTANQHTGPQGAGDGLHPIASTTDWARSPLASITPAGAVASHHHQGIDRALAESAGLRTLASSLDGVLEAFDDPDRPFYVGVQWHPERTADPALGDGVIARLVEAARRVREARR